MRKKYTDTRGTTLIELVLYIAIASFIFINIAAIVSQIVYNQTKIEAITREDENARNLMRIISQDIQSAKTINSPNAVNATSSPLNITDLSNNTIIYTLTNGVVTKQYAGGSIVALSSTDIYITNLTFEVESEAGVAPSINIKIDIQQSASNSSTATHYETTDAQRVF